jgi:biopolymer transport protein ExbD
MGQRVKDSDDDLISDINIVPFVDILLVILIIFMVTAPVVMRPSLKIQLPEASTGDKTEFTPFQLTVSSKEQIVLNGEPIAFENLKVLAEQFISQNPMGQAVISADENVPHGDVIAILDQIKLGGVKKLGLSIRND